MSVINTNITSMIGQQNLRSSQNDLATSMERLSSGLRINSAKDDAAGQAIANRMSAQINGLSQAQRNANDGISVAQTAEGALNQVNDNLQRVRVLTDQAANGTNSQKDLDSIQAEIDQRLGEINRISEQTDFNGVKVLSGDQGLKIQVGANDDEVITVKLEEINAGALGLEGFNVNDKGEVANEAATANDLTLDGFTPTTGTPEANGALEYSKTETTANNRMTSADLMGQLDDNATIDLSSTSSTGFTSSSSDVGFDGVDGGSVTYSATNDNFTYDVTAAEAASVASKLTPGAGEGPQSATVTIGGTDTNVLVNEDGSMTNESGEALYIDGSGNLTATTSGANSTYANATVDNLTALMAGDDNSNTITAADGSTALTVGTDIGADAATASITLADGSSYAGTNGADINVTGAVADKDSVAGMLAADGGDVTLQAAIGAEDETGSAETVSAFTVDGNGEVTVGTAGGTGGLSATNELYTDGDGNFTEATETTATTTYFAQESGAVTDNTGAQVFKNADGDLTMDDVTVGDRTADPLATLDSALNQVDELRSELGAVQNRFESAITNLSTNETNLSAARSRIEDADYAVEVANMTKNQILQQAGTSVLAQANQLPQNVLSLLG